MPGDQHHDVRRHAGPQPEVRVLRGDHGGVGDDALLDDGLEPHHLDLAPEGTVGERVHGERHREPGPHHADVGLVDAGLDLHLGEIVRDHEQLRRLQARRHGLAAVDVARDDDAVDRRPDHRVLEVHLRRIELRARRLEVGLALLHGDLGGLDVGLRDVVLRHQLARAAERALRVLERCLGACDRRLVLHDARSERRRLQLAQHLPGAHARVVVGGQPAHRAAHLAADLDLHDRAHRPGRGDGQLDGATRGLVGAVLRRLATPPRLPHPEEGHEDHGQDGHDEPAGAVQSSSSGICVRPGPGRHRPVGSGVSTGILAEAARAPPRRGTSAPGTGTSARPGLVRAPRQAPGACPPSRC